MKQLLFKVIWTQLCTIDLWLKVYRTVVQTLFKSCTNSCRVKKYVSLIYVKWPAKALFYPKAFHLNLWYIKWLMKLSAVLLFVISSIQKHPAIWAILLFITSPIFVLAKSVYIKCTCALGNKATVPLTCKRSKVLTFVSFCTPIILPSQKF
jgi:hypothetical protein